MRQAIYDFQSPRKVCLRLEKTLKLFYSTQHLNIQFVRKNSLKDFIQQLFIKQKKICKYIKC